MKRTVSKSKERTFEVRFLGALKWHLCNLGLILDRRLKLRTALHEGTEGHMVNQGIKKLSMHMWLQSEQKYSLPPHVEMVLHYQQRGNGLFNGHTLHTSVVCKALTGSTQQSEERRRKRQKQADEMTKHPCLFVFFTTHSYFTHAVSGENCVCSLKTFQG